MLSMIVYNTLERRGRKLLARVVESSLQVPYDLALIIDDGEDRTGEYIRGLLRRRGREAIVAKSDPSLGKATRATARQTAINTFLMDYKHNWLFFLDDDIVLLDGWWDEARQYTSEARVGIIWGINWDPNSVGKDIERYVGAFRLRGGLHDTLLRREALHRLPPIPPKLHIYEDAWIYWNIICRGWEYRIVRRGGIHYGGDDPYTSIGAEAIYEAYRLLGIIEDYRPNAYKDYRSRVKPFILTIRPLLGLILGLPRAYSNSQVRRHVRIQMNKLKARWHQAMARLKYGPPPENPCTRLHGGA